MFFHMVATLEICLRRLIKVKIAFRHSHPGLSLRHSRPAPVDATARPKALTLTHADAG